MKIFLMIMLLAAAGAGSAFAHHESGGQHPGQAQAPATGRLAEGEVRKVDKDAKKITIKHGPIQNLDMPPMTMVFHVKYPGMLDYLKAGDKVKFEAQKLGGAFTVTRIETVK